MKLLFMIVNLEKGGAQRVMLNLCHALSKDHSIDVLTLRDSEVGYPIDSLNHIKLSGSENKNRFVRFYHQRKQVKTIIDKNKYDLVISFLPETNFMNTSIHKHNRKIINVRNDPKVEYRGIFNLLMRHFYPKADVCVVQTQVIKEYFMPYLDKIEVIPNPVSKIPHYDVSRTPIVLNVGRYVAQKNQAMLIQAFSEFHKSYPNYECHIVGQGPLKQELYDLIISLGCEDCIKLIEPSDEIFKIMQEAEIFVLSSNYEGYPNVLLEAMACGCASISTDCASGAPREIIQHEVNGLIVNINDKEELLSALIRYTNPTFRDFISQNALDVNTTHTFEQFIQSYQLIIESLSNQNVKN